MSVQFSSRFFQSTNTGQDRSSAKIVLLVLATISALFLSHCAKVNVFQEPPDYPVIDSVAPAVGKVGTQIRLFGTGFSTNSQENQVTINGVQIQVDSPSTAKVVLATITDATGTGHVNISVNGNQAEGPIFTYDEKAISINSISPGSGWTDTLVTIKGVNFGIILDSVKVEFNGHAAAIIKLTDTLIQVRAPASATNNLPGVAIVVVKVGEKTSNGVQFSYSNQTKPVIIKADYGWNDGNGYSISVQNLPLDDNSIQLFANGVQVKFDHVSRANGSFYDPNAGDQALVIIKDSAIENHVPSNYADYVVVCNGVRSASFRYILIPRITSVDPQNANAGDVLTIGGLFFGDRTYPSRVPFYQGPNDTLTDAQVISWTTTSISLKIPTYNNLIPYGGDPQLATIGLVVRVGDKQSYNTYFFYKLGSGGGKVILTLLAGDGKFGYIEGTGSSAEFNAIDGITTDPQGMIYATDRYNRRIRKITPAGMVTTFAGNGTYGWVEGPAPAAEFMELLKIAFDANGNAYTTDNDYSAIRRVSVDHDPPVVSTFAGQQLAGDADGTGTSAQFNNPYGITSDVQNNVYVSDFYGNSIRKITPGAVVTTLVNNPTLLANPEDIATDIQGNIYEVSYYLPSVKKISPTGEISTLAGNDSARFNQNRVSTDGKGPSAVFTQPVALAVDPQSNVYVMDWNVNGGQILLRKISQDGMVTTLTTLSEANYGRVLSIAIDKQGNMYAASETQIYKVTIQ